MMKILCTGNPNKLTIANAVNKIFENVDFIHLSNGYNFLTKDGLDKFTKKIKNYNVFINASRIDIGVQINLLKITRKQWTSGHVINIGTTMEFHFFNHIDQKIANDKLNLRKLSLDMYDENFRSTHFIVGGSKDQSLTGQNKMDPIHIAKIIKWIIESGNQFHIPIIGIENDFWNKGQIGSSCDWQQLKNKGRDYSLYD